MESQPGSAEYWNHRYDTIGASNVSWFQPVPERSIAAIEALHPGLDACIVDVGGGASTLVDAVLVRGYENLTVVDLSAHALTVATQRVTSAFPDHRVEFVSADIRDWQPGRQFDIWHDRAVYHFLTESVDQRRYWNLVGASLRPGGHIIIATFADDGPTMCSGLPVQRNSEEQLIEAMGDGFTPISTARETHVTPSGGEQRFVWVTARKD